MSDETNAPTELELLKKRADVMGIKYSNNISLATLRERVNAKATGETPEDNDADDDGHDDATGEFVEGNTEAADNEDDDLVDAPVETPAALQTTAEAAVAPPVPTPAPAAPLVQVVPEPAPVAAPVAPAAPRRISKAEAEQAIRTEMYEKEMKLIRIRVTNMDPKKADLPGEIFTVANEYLGTVRRYVPFGEQTDNGYHVEKCIYDQLVERQFQHIRTIKDPKTGTPQVTTKMVREFALEILPPLTKDELHDLAIAQAAAGSIDR